MGDFNPLQRFLKGETVAYYSPWVEEGMRRSGVAKQLVTPGGENISNTVAAYVTLAVATFASQTAPVRERHKRVIARFVHTSEKRMATAVANIFRADYMVILSGFYLLNPSSSDFCRVAEKSYGAAGESLEETTLLPGTFFGFTMKKNVEGIVESLALIAAEVHKPSIDSASLLEPVAVYNNPRWS